MPTLSQDVQASALRETNQRLRTWLERLVPDREPTGLAASEHLMGLLSELRRAGEWLRAEMPSERGAELEIELKTYRQNVERLHELLPFMHSQLLQEKARLEAERTRIEAAEAWARSSRQTL